MRKLAFLLFTAAFLFALCPGEAATETATADVLAEPLEGPNGPEPLAPPRQAEADRESKQLAVDLIRPEGNLRETPSFWIGYEQLSKEALRERATRLLKASPELEVVVRADRTMKHEHVAELLELLKAVGAKNVSLAVFPLGSVFAIDPRPVAAAGQNGGLAENTAEVEVLLDEEESYVEFSGRVVDDETGKPVERFGLQWGLPHTADSNEIAWGGITMHAQSRRDGKFHERIGCGKGNHAGLRILADGYVPQAVTPQAVVSPAKRTGLVVRLKRGLEVRGRVVDQAGKPVADAIVCLGGNQMVNFVDGRLEYFSGSRTSTGKDGRFALQGAATEKSAENKSCLLVSAKPVHVWRASLPEPGKVAEITLPEPATLKIRYDVPGGDDPGRFRLHLKTWEMEAWKGVVESVQKPTPQNGGQVVLENLAPGVYDLSRTKQIRVGHFGQGAFCGRRDVRLEAGKTIEVQFVRKTGYPITGQVTGLKGTGVKGAFIFVRPAGAGEDPRNRDEWKMDTFDALSCDVEGRFKTETIPPGDYNVVAQAYHPMDRSGPMSTGERLPDLIGTAKVTVSPDGPPAAVRIEVRPAAALPGAGQRPAGGGEPAHLDLSPGRRDEVLRRLPRKPAHRSSQQPRGGPYQGCSLPRNDDRGRDRRFQESPPSP